MLKHYVEYLYPGTFFTETSVSEISKRDVNMVNIPDTCFGFRFFDRTVTIVNGEKLTGDRKNMSGIYYLGKKMTIDEVKKAYGNDPKYETLISNMVHNNYQAVVKTKFGQFLPFGENDTIL